MNNSKLRFALKGLLLLCSGVLLILGSTLLFNSAPVQALFGRQASLHVTQSLEPSFQPAGHFKAQTVKRLQFSDTGKPLFSLIIANYQDQQNLSHSVILFPPDRQPVGALTNPAGVRHALWENAATAINDHAPADSLMLSWWDDGQRLHFLTGRDTWLTKPAKVTFTGELWKALEAQLPVASVEETPRLAKMAAWLTMDSDQALAEMAAYFGHEHPVYLLVSNDLLLRLSELKAYGGSPLDFHTQRFPVNDDLHGDIAQVKRWANETGDGNYLAQKEGQYYRVWSPANPATQKTLLVRLLPFVDSLKALPKKIQRVYQSSGGGYLSVYRLEMD